MRKAYDIHYATNVCNAYSKLGQDSTIVNAFIHTLNKKHNRRLLSVITALMGLAAASRIMSSPAQLGMMRPLLLWRNWILAQPSLLQPRQKSKA